jgi:phage-related tail fiber protein
LEENSSRFNHETVALNMTLKVEAEKNLKLSEALRTLKDKCFDFASQCTARLKSIFNLVGAASEEASLSAEDVPGALERVEKEVDILDEVITSQGDFCALVASRGTTASFIKVGCNHARAVNRPNFILLPSDLVDISAEARSIGNRFITQIWVETKLEIYSTKYSSLPLFFYFMFFLTISLITLSFIILQGDGAEG